MLVLQQLLTRHEQCNWTCRLIKVERWQSLSSIIAISCSSSLSEAISESFRKKILNLHCQLYLENTVSKLPWKYCQQVTLKILSASYLENTVSKLPWKYCQQATLKILSASYLENTVSKLPWKYCQQATLKILSASYLENTVSKLPWKYCQQVTLKILSASYLENTVSKLWIFCDLLPSIYCS